METKRMISGMMLAIGVILGYQFFISWLWKHNNWKVPTPPTATTQQSPTTGPTSDTVASATADTTAPTTAPSTQMAGTRVIGASTTQPAQPTDIGSAAANDPIYAMQIHLDPQGAAIDNVTLNQFKLKDGSPDPYTFDQPDDLSPQDEALASRSIVINGQSFDLADVSWQLDKPDPTTPGQATYFVDIQKDDKLVARVRKTYQLDSRPASKDKSEGYEALVTIAIQNLSGAPITASTVFNGPLPPRPEVSRGIDRTILGGYDNAGLIDLNHHAIEELKVGHETQDLTTSEKTSLPFVWAGIGGTYFNAIVRPLPINDKASPPQYLKDVQAVAIHPEVVRDHPEVAINFTTQDLRIEPGASLAIPMRVFFGPKPRWLLNNPYYSAPLIGYDQTLVMASGACAFCTFTWLIDVLVNLLRAFHWVFGGFAGHGDWGLAIIALVLLVRLMLHPITKRSQVNMMKMTKMGPETERLKKKYGDDKEALTKAQMEMYKSMGFTPVLGCLPLFLQMPIFIALWQALQSTFELRQAPFLWNLTWIKDLSQPDYLIRFSHSIPLIFNWHIDGLNVLPILVAVVSFVNMKYTPRPPAATPEAEQQQKMMQWMTLVFPLMFYSFPSGLNLYYLSSTSLGIWESKRIRAHIKQHEEAEKAGKVIIDASPGKRNRSKKNEPPEEPKGRIAAWIARIMERAEQVRLEAEKKKRN